MPIANRIPALLASLLILATSSLVHAEGLVVRATDSRGVTLELSLPQWSLSAPKGDGCVTVLGVPRAHSLAEPGRPLLPAYSGVVALPPDARPTVRVNASEPEVTRDNVRMAIAGRPGVPPCCSGPLRAGSLTAAESRPPVGSAGGRSGAAGRGKPRDRGSAKGAGL